VPEEGVVADVIPLRKENFGSILDGGIVFFCNFYSLVMVMCMCGAFYSHHDRLIDSYRDHGVTGKRIYC